MRISKNYYLFGTVILFIVLISLVFFFFNPEEIVAQVGVKNTYLVVFLISAIGGLSTLTGGAVFTTIATFAAGGASSLGLTLAGGAGIFISDSIFYFLVQYGLKSIPTTWENSIEKMRKWIVRHPDWMVLLGTYIYISFTPLPNDLLMIGLVIGGYSYKKIVWVLLAGSLTVAFLTTYLGNVILN